MLIGVGAAEPAAMVDKDVQDEVQQLVRQLDADQLTIRETAERRLIELGPAILTLLPAPSRDTSAEVSARVARIRQTLERQAAATVAQPSYVTLRGSFSLSAALAELERQTGNRTVDFRARFGQAVTDPQLMLDLERMPFWKALDAVLDQAELTVYGFGGERGALAIVRRDPGHVARAVRGVYHGPFRFEAVRIQATRELAAPANDLLRITLGASWEPRLSPILLQFPLADVQARDDQGRALVIGPQQASLEVPVEGAISAAEIQLPFELPPSRVERIASLTGRVDALLPGRVEAFEFDDLPNARRREQRRAGVTVVLDQVRQNVDTDEVRILVRFDQAGKALESHRSWIYRNEAYFLDPDGHRFEPVGMQAFRQTGNEVGVAYSSSRQQGLAGCKFVYKTPTLLITTPIEFELKDIPLP